MDVSGAGHPDPSHIMSEAITLGNFQEFFVGHPEVGRLPHFG
jgi:hypothetical protein